MLLVYVYTKNISYKDELSNVDILYCPLAAQKFSIGQALKCVQCNLNFINVFMQSMSFYFQFMEIMLC